MLKPVSPEINFPKLEEEILSYWKENNIFEKSIANRSDTKKWTFLDGPPFITGMPHYGTLLASLPKDLFGRYWTMKGYKVRRVWGWDCHGLPAENKVEVKLGIKSKREIEEKIGVKKFIEECKKYVSEVSSEWEWYVDHIGRWVNFKDAYKTMDTPYMESVMWVFKQMYDKGYIYKGLRVSLYCPHCGTPISNFEVAMDADNHKEIQDFATTYKYQLENEKDTFILAWSTTPWNKIVTPALAINPSFTYVKVKQGNEYYILAKSTLKHLNKEPKYEVVETINGKDLLGRKFVPHYDYYPIEKGEKSFEIVGGDFVTAEEGTGVVTIAAYGEEDLKLMKEQNIHIETHLDDEGNIKENVPLFGGLYYLKANKFVNEDLTKRGLVYRDEQLLHTVPLCWRCHTRLYFAPQNAWFVNIQELKPMLKETNESINWFPKHFKYGRFLKSLENAPDWNISRSRYWGSPVPVWECECGENIVPGSIKELEKLSGKKITDLHKPGIDEIVIKCQKCGKKAHRVPEVLDSWIEAGSASFAERHFPFSGKDKLEDFFPPDFIVEYTGQIRAWFYVLHVIGGALYTSNSFKNVGVTGVILGTDGRKMSKNFGNYPDPKEMLEKFGGDALRLYLMGSPVMHGEDIIISEEQYRNQVRGTMLILWNIYNFFITYAQMDNWNPATIKSDKQVSTNVLDLWILSLLSELGGLLTKSLDNYDTVTAIDHIKVFIDQFSTWYIRRSRERTGIFAQNTKDKTFFYDTTYTVLTSLCKLLAPFTPFLTESMFRNLTDEESVHLQDWPEIDKKFKNEALETEMKHGIELASLLLMQRKQFTLPVKIPIRKITYKGPIAIERAISSVIQAEVNCYELTYLGKSDKYELPNGKKEFTDLENQDQVAGNVRDIIRKIQSERKKLGTTFTEKINVSLEQWPKEYEDEIMKKANISTLTKGQFSVSRL